MLKHEKIYRKRYLPQEVLNLIGAENWRDQKVSYQDIFGLVEAGSALDLAVDWLQDVGIDVLDLAKNCTHLPKEASLTLRHQVYRERACKWLRLLAENQFSWQYAETRPDWGLVGTLHGVKEEMTHMAGWLFRETGGDWWVQDDPHGGDATAWYQRPVGK